ncbi:hypothetical protein PR048_011146 [Dryococelus australis]|uniref:Uncharacterized protein n=1 Tax=Dryococelus australis TaxID=614101 RepID=A0ABQ9HL98_9NEOP|nr:hypothetical protein PR048_011146 [Dryococelus australis]
MPAFTKPKAPTWCARTSGLNLPQGSKTLALRYQACGLARANLVGFVVKSLLDSNMWESCRTMPLVGGFSRHTFIPVLLHSHLTSPSSALKISMLRAVQISSLHSITLVSAQTFKSTENKEYATLCARAENEQCREPNEIASHCASYMNKSIRRKDGVFCQIEKAVLKRGATISCYEKSDATNVVYQSNDMRFEKNMLNPTNMVVYSRQQMTLVNKTVAYSRHGIKVWPCQ